MDGIRRLFEPKPIDPNLASVAGHHLRNATTLAIAVGLLAAFATALIGFDPPDADVKYDWLSAKAALTSNAYEDILDLGQEHGVHLVVHYPEGAERPFAHPRTPGAILLALPLLVLDFDLVFASSVGLTFAIGTLMVMLLTDLSGPRLLGVLLLFGVSAPFVTTVRFAGQSLVAAACALLGWILYQRRRDLLAGLLIAVAGTLKLFPLVLVIPMLLQRRFRAVLFTVVAFFALNWAGLLLPGVALRDSVVALLEGADDWFRLLGNGSLAGVLARWGLDRWIGQMVAMALALAIVVWAKRRQKARLFNDPTLWLVLALITLPVSWFSYDVVLMPALVVGLWSSRTSDRLVLLGVWAASIGMSLALLLGAPEADRVVDMGWPTILVRLLIVVGWCVAAIDWDWRRCWLMSATTTQTASSTSIAPVRAAD